MESTKSAKSVSEEIKAFLYARFPLARQARIGTRDPLLEHGLVDSLGVLEIVAFVEQHFGVTIDDEELLPQHFGSIDALAELVGRKCNGCRIQPLPSPP